MLEKSQKNQQTIGLTLASLAILSFLGLQLYTAEHLRDFWPKFRKLQYPYKLLKPPETPALWPFIDYPMYSYPKYLGNGINQYFMFGILEDSSEVRLLPEDLGLDYWVFLYGFKDSLRLEKRDWLNKFAEIYEKRHGKKLIGFRLEDRPLILGNKEVKQGETKVLKDLRIEELEEKK